MIDENKIIEVLQDISSVKTGIINLNEHIARLDKRINGTFDTIGEHIKESPIYRDKIGNLETEVKNIKGERLNTTKNAQWRIAIIVGIICGLPSMVFAILKILEYFR